LLVDAPVSGGVTGAERGSLTIMVGGSAGDVRRVRGLLDTLGSRVIHVGEVGAGHAVKAPAVGPPPLVFLARKL
jgi:3-hydroxyisobutyrate dehydrogenase